jgi:Lipopolysaccharide assembly protein A domain
MRRFLTVALCLAVAAVVVPIGLANRQFITLSLDPFGRTATPLAIDLPLSLLMFAMFMLGLLAGALATWFGQGKWRRTARHKAREAFQWKAEADRLARDQGGPASAGPYIQQGLRGRRGSQTTKLAHGR